jgi:hypothetical protein
MIEALALDLLFLATVLVYGAGAKRGSVRWAWFATHVRAARSVALGFTMLAIAYWQHVEPGPIAFLVALVGLMTSASVVALLGPLAPQWLWGSALSGALALPYLLWLGGLP